MYNYDYGKDKTNNKSSKISLEDIISEVAIIIYKDKSNKNYHNNKKKFRLKTLENYFIYGGYKNHDKVSNALRRLSRDSDDAAKQFYEMLSDNEYEKNM